MGAISLAKKALALKKSKPKPKLTVKRRQQLRKAELERALKARANENPPATQRIFGRRGAGARSIDEIEDTRIDPETGGSVDAARGVGTKGERVALDTRGPRDRGFVVDEAGGRVGAARARRQLLLANKIDDGTATKAERLEFMRNIDRDLDAGKRQRGQSIASRQRKSTAAKLSARQREDARQKFMQTGEIVEGYDPKAPVEAQAIRNIMRRRTLAAGDDTGDVVAAMKEVDAAKTKPRSRRNLSGIREEDVGGMNVGGMKKKLTRAQKKKRESLLTYTEQLKAAKRAKQKKKRKSYMTATPVIRGQSVTAARGGLMKSKHKDYRKGGLFKKGK